MSIQPLRVALLGTALFLLGGIVFHAQLDLRLDVLQSFARHKLSERVQPILVEQSDEVVAESTHFGLAGVEALFEYAAGTGRFEPPTVVAGFAEALAVLDFAKTRLLGRSLGIGAFAGGLLKAHDHETTSGVVNIAVIQIVRNKPV